MFGESTSKKAKTVLSIGNVMGTVFEDFQGIILIDYLQKDKIITGQYNATLLDRLKEELKKNGQDWRARKCSSTEQCVVPQVDRCNGKII